MEPEYSAAKGDSFEKASGCRSCDLIFAFANAFSDISASGWKFSAVNPLQINYWVPGSVSMIPFYNMTPMIDLYMSSKETFVSWDFPYILSRKLLFPYWSIDLCFFFDKLRWYTTPRTVPCFTGELLVLWMTWSSLHIQVHLPYQHIRTLFLPG